MESYFISFITNYGDPGNVIVDISSGLRGRALYDALDEALAHYLEDCDVDCSFAEIMFFREV